jgi:hypothetical protein
MQLLANPPSAPDALVRMGMPADWNQHPVWNDGKTKGPNVAKPTDTTPQSTSDLSDGESTADDH